MGMTKEKCLEVLDLYEGLQGVKISPMSHIFTMIPKMRVFLEEERREKFMRWLGFIQGVLYINDLYSIEDLANHNRPTPAPSPPGPQEDEPKE